MIVVALVVVLVVILMYLLLRAINLWGCSLSHFVDKSIIYAYTFVHIIHKYGILYFLSFLVYILFFFTNICDH